MPRLFFGNILVLLCLLGILVIIGTWVVSGWTGYLFGLLQVGGVAFLTTVLVVELRDRPRYDPVRQYLENLYNRIT